MANELENNGMDNNAMDNMDDLVIFEDDEGNEYSFTVEDYFFYNGEEYALLADAEEDEEGNKGCIVCQVVSAENDEDEEFVPVADEDLAEKLYQIATTRMNEEEEEEE